MSVSPFSMDIGEDVLKRVIDKAHELTWTVTSFGTIRCKIEHNTDTYLHIWNSELDTPKGIRLHKYKYGINANVVRGFMTVNIYEEMDRHWPWTLAYYRQKTNTNNDEDMAGKVCEIVLVKRRVAYYYGGGDACNHHDGELYTTEGVDGTVAIVTEIRNKEGGTVYNFWRAGTHFADEGDRPATAGEIDASITKILDAPLGKWVDDFEYF